MDWKDEVPGFENLISDIASIQADFILEKNAKQNLVKVNGYLIAIKERVLIEEELGNDEIIKAFKAIGFSFYRLKEAFELLIREGY